MLAAEETNQPHISEQSSPLESIPNHIGIIMDGNGRWAALKKKSMG